MQLHIAIWQPEALASLQDQGNVVAWSQWRTFLVFHQATGGLNAVVQQARYLPGLHSPVSADRSFGDSQAPRAYAHAHTYNLTWLHSAVTPEHQGHFGKI